MLKERISQTLADHAKTIDEAFRQQSEAIASFAEKVADVFHQGGRLLVAGGGALGPLADHVANLFLYRLELERPVLPAISLGHDQTLALSLTQDGQSRQFFARQLRALAAPGDLLLGFAGLHRDEALEEAVAAARALNCTSAVFAGGEESLGGEEPDVLFTVASDSPARVMEGALFFGHLLCDLVESQIFGI
ncbi:MAG TPA: SIS domain-containing protein [Desulfuromonadales bacterium]|nr:SIS domain-containing protein [Desulfuromonadales bacterium]